MVAPTYSLAPPSLPSAASEGRAFRFTVVAFDFERKIEQTIAVERIQACMQGGQFVWIDCDVADVREGAQALDALGLVAPEVVHEALHGDPATLCARHDDYLHLVVTGCRAQGSTLDLERVDVIVGARFLMTIHRGPAQFLSAVKRDYRGDFVRFAKSPSFLLYEIWDHLLENYRAIQKDVEERVERLQAELRADDVTDAVFARVSELDADLQHLRKVLLPARAVLGELSSRKTIFISEATQAFLGTMGNGVEHVLQDLVVDRDILTGSVNLYMSLVSHRTNAVMKRLTVVSVVFMPLTCLVGIYGMNFEAMPELRWEHGYAYFWAVALVLVVVIVAVLKKNKLL